MSIFPPEDTAVEEENEHIDALVAALDELLAAPLPSWSDLLAITLPAPNESLEKFMRLIPRSMGVLFRSRSGCQVVCGGVTDAIGLRGEDRFRALSVLVPRVFKRITSRGVGPLPHPIMIGGAGFAPVVSVTDPWTEFADDLFVLPRWCFRRGPQSSLTITVPRSELADPTRLRREMRHLLFALEEELPTTQVQQFAIAPSAVHHVTPEEWAQYIAAIQRELDTGRFTKLVAARPCRVDLAMPVKDVSFMARIAAAYPDCTQYAFRRDNSTFLGATPETLFVKRGLELKTHALAGTTRISDPLSEDSVRDVAALTTSTKDLGEHDVVVKEIKRQLADLSRTVHVDPTPETRTVRHLIHLQTPIRAELKESTTVFNLLEALHPTPAIGGFPAREAVEWIRRNEPLERGWYSGVIGWMDAAGDGEFAVAIGCGVLTKKHAYIFAGAGIVAASDAAAEYAETGAKMAPLLHALGVVA